MRNMCLLFFCRTKGIFGQSLEDTLKYELERDPNREVPEIVQICVEFLYENGLEVGGLFRFVSDVVAMYIFMKSSD